MDQATGFLKAKFAAIAQAMELDTGRLITRHLSAPRRVLRVWLRTRLRLRRMGLPKPRKVLRYMSLALTIFLLAPYALTLVYIFIDPPMSALMLRQRLAGQPAVSEWRDLAEISRALPVQVIVSEDGRFCRHHGVDWDAIDAAIASADEGGKPRGASTISMQTAKNLFLWTRPAFLRKAFEIPLASYMDLVLGKRRVIEIYLNIAEWGPGIYGAEAAAQYHFGVRASELTRQDAAQLAASLPNPKRRDAGQPGPGTYALANRLRQRAENERSAAACIFGRSR